MNAIKLISVMAVSLFLCFALAAVADHPLFEKVDANKDGKIDREELARHMKASAFESLDNDRDEGIAQSEWENMHYITDEDRHREIFRSVDKDRDSRISLPEFTDYIEKYSNIEDAFMLLDKDRDGGLAPDEISYIPSFRLITIHY